VELIRRWVCGLTAFELGEVSVGDARLLGDGTERDGTVAFELGSAETPERTG
jgi:hypothetical protein